MPVEQSNFFVDGDAKALVQLFTATNKQVILASQNKDSFKVFQKENQLEIIRPRPLEWKAIISYKDGIKEVKELYYGCGYLSASTRAFAIDLNQVEKIDLIDYQGNKRTLN